MREFDTGVCEERELELRIAMLTPRSTRDALKTVSVDQHQVLASVLLKMAHRDGQIATKRR